MINTLPSIVCRNINTALLIFLGVLAVGFGCHKGSKFPNFLAIENIKGRVKSCTETFYPIEEKDSQFTKGEMYFRTVYTIDENGNKKDWKEFNADGSLRWKAVSKYDGNKETECDGYKPDGALDWKSVFKYDDKGKRTEEEEFDGSGKKTSRIEFRYNEEGVKTERLYFSADGSLYSRSVYIIDSTGNVADEEVYDAGGTMKSHNTNLYDHYDPTGNWLRQTVYAGDNPAMVSERVIEYY